MMLSHRKGHGTEAPGVLVEQSWAGDSAGRAAGAVQVPGVPQDGATAPALAGCSAVKTPMLKAIVIRFMDSHVCTGCALDR